MKRTRVAIVGGGLAGLAAARVLEAGRHTVVVLESADEFGGQIKTEREGGYVVELGAEGFVSRSEALPRLAQKLGLGDELRGQTTTRSLGYKAGTLTELAPGEAAAFLGFQVPKDDLGQGTRTFARGMGALVDTLTERLSARVELRTGFQAAALTRRERSYVITSSDGASLDAEQVVVATSASHAARLLGPLFGPPALTLAQASTLSSVTVSLAYERAAIAHPLDATGLVLASDEQTHGARACAFVSSKYEGRAPSDKALLRVFFRPSEADITLTADATYARWAAEIVARTLGVDVPALRSWVSRWPSALPVFDAAHKQRVQALEVALAGSGVALAGSAFHGAGIDAAVRSAESVIERLSQ